MNFYDSSPEQIAKLSGPWCCSFSGGKDSTSLVTWIEWLRRTGQIAAPRPQLVQSDTKVEDPALNAPVGRHLVLAFVASQHDAHQGVFPLLDSPFPNGVGHLITVFGI